jgi:uncharacterized protein (DUF433 family)
MDYSRLITIEPDKRSGQPCIRGLRMTVQDVLEYLAGGMSFEEILADFPDLTTEDIRACLIDAICGTGYLQLTIRRRRNGRPQHVCQEDLP